MAKKRVCRGKVATEPVSVDREMGPPAVPGNALVLRKAPRPSGCSRFVRREIADAMPEICAMLLTRVIRESDLQSLKMLLLMAAGGQSVEREGTARARDVGQGFGRKVLMGFREFEARETGLRRES